MRPGPGFRVTHFLALIPVVGILSAPLVANRVEPRILGLPFLLAWIVFWVVTTSVTMAVIGALDSAAEKGQPQTEND